ncbi:MAG: endonuclease/exonuclease/phosphatase family protein [Polyangiaceae bacterium]|nr:endonuclease/exonuclease/phosphatase family protein [Polyangiaceae bacterium]
MTQRVRVVTYNVRYFGHGTRGLASTGKQMERIAHALAALEPLADIVCLQEVETMSFRSNVAHPTSERQRQLERLMSMLHESLKSAGKRDTYKAYYFPAHTYGSTTRPIYTTGLAVIARRDFHVLHHNAERPHDITHRRIHAVARLKQTRVCAHVRVVHKRGADFDIFNTHLSLPTTFSREFWLEPRRLGWGPNQVAEAKNLIDFVARERTNERYFIVGDFNALAGSPVYRELIDAGLRDAFAHYHGMEEEALNGFPTAGFMNLRMHLDYVFTGAGLTWLDFDGTHRFGQRGGCFKGLSDHVPIVGTFTFA